MSNWILLPLCFFVGTAIGFVMCALFSANGPAPKRQNQDALRLDFVHQNNLHLGCHTADGQTSWAVLDQGKIVSQGLADNAREAIDRARAAWQAP